MSKRIEMLFMKLNGKSRKKELITSLAVMVVSVSAFSATYEEARAFIEPPSKSWLLSHHDREHPDFNSVISNDMHHLVEDLVPAQEDPCFPQADPEIHGIPADALEGLSATIHGHFEGDYIVGAEFLVIKSERFRRYVGLGIPRTRHDDFLFYAIKRSGYRHKA